MTTFDPQSFLQTNFVDPSLTKKVPCPVGDYPATVEKLDAREWRAKEDSSKFGVALDIFWSINDEGVKSALEKDKVLVKQTIMFSCNPDGSIDREKAKTDISFGRLREAVGLNDTEFQPGMLLGRSALVRVGHRPGKNPEDIYDEVTGVAAL